MTAKKPLAPGDRVRAYGFWLSTGYDSVDGEVTRLEGKDGVRIKSDRYTEISAHRKQVRRLRKREPAKVEPRIERAEGWYSKETATYAAHFTTHPQTSPAYVRLVEVREGERVLSRKELAEAWEAALPSYALRHKGNKEIFDKMAKALGFGSGEA